MADGPEHDEEQEFNDRIRIIEGFAGMGDLVRAPTAFARPQRPDDPR